ncbi:MAG: 2-hydroxychromene-2-carboxylate isomerase [Caulobacterales bacterium]|nr:2-hydroxychromene-2-carboxylate isomerase [Caulobacterales bacterium]
MAVQFLFDFGSPNAFLSHRVIPAIAARTGARFDYLPVLLGGLFKLTGNQSPVQAFGHIKNKLAYEGLETRRFIARHGIADFRANPHFPVNTLAIMRGAMAAQQLGVFEAYVDRVFDDMWVRGLKMDDPAVVREALVAGGLSADEIARLSQTDEVKGRLLANTQYAFEKGAFGSPSFLVGDELYFGKDRLGEVEAEIVRQAASAAA